VTLFTPLNPAFVAAVREARKNDHLQDALMRGRGGRVLTDLAWEVSIKGILPVTEVGTRRDSRTISHLFYTTSQPQSTKEYSRPGGGNYVEFRGTNVDGTLGHQTFIRGKHPNGETVVFHHKGHAIRQAVHRYRHRTSGPPLVHRRHRPVRQGGNRASGYV
jgi:hypothetical protein